MLLVEGSISPDVKAQLIEDGYDDDNWDPNVLYKCVWDVLINRGAMAAQKDAEEAAEEAADST